jgi:hypothetical protein
VCRLWGCGVVFFSFFFCFFSSSPAAGGGGGPPPRKEIRSQFALYKHNLKVLFHEMDLAFDEIQYMVSFRPK